MCFVLLVHYLHKADDFYFDWAILFDPGLLLCVSYL